MASLYKHILGWPVLMADLEAHDADVYQNLLKVPVIAGHIDARACRVTVELPCKGVVVG